MNVISRGSLVGGLLTLGLACAQGEDEAASAQLSDVAALEADALQQVPPPAGVKFTTVGASGAGCPQNTPGADDSYYVDLTPEGDAFTLELYKFRANVTPTDARPETSLSCSLRFGLTVPSGYSYTITDVVYQGESNLPASTTASLVTSYGYQGSGVAPTNITHPIKTPSTLQQFKFRDVLNATASGTAQRWSNCGESQILNLNLVLHIRNPQKVNGWAELGYVDADVRTTREDLTPSTIPGLTVNLAWRRCPQR